MARSQHHQDPNNTNTRNIKKVVQAAAEVGVMDVIFSSYKVEVD